MRRACSWLWVAGFALSAQFVPWAARAHAQDSTQPVAPAPVPAPASSDDVIDDPELAGVAAAPEPPPAAPAADNAEVRAVLRSRAGIDLAWQDPHEDVFEATQLALLEARVRRSPSVSFALGLRMRHFFATREHATPEADADRYELDIAPTAGYADLTLAPSLQLRVGYQSVQLGRFDVLDAGNVLMVADLRSGPATMAEAAEIAQPAVRADWDPLSWLSLRALYLPFFAPDRVNAFSGDYALAPASRGDALSQSLDVIAGDDGAELLSQLLRRALSRSGQDSLGEAALSAFTPEPSLSHPQAALRAVAHGPSGELGLTAATALERLPAFHASDALLAYLNDASVDNRDALIVDPEPFAARYDRLGVVALDGAMPIGPLQLGAQLAFVAHRSLLAQAPGELALPVHANLLQAGVRLEHAQSAHWLFGLEASGARVLGDPERAGQRYLFMAGRRYLLSAVGLVACSPGSFGLSVELGGALLDGISYALLPRVEQRIVDQLYVELGASIVGGKKRALGDPRVTVGALYDDSDQVFLGVRYLP